MRRHLTGSGAPFARCGGGQKGLFAGMHQLIPDAYDPPVPGGYMTITLARQSVPQWRVHPTREALWPVDVIPPEAPRSRSGIGQVLTRVPAGASAASLAQSRFSYFDD